MCVLTEGGAILSQIYKFAGHARCETSHMSENTLTRGVTGKHTNRGIPARRTSLTPFLTVRDARGALAFYEKVFGARVADVTEMGGGVVHAEIDFGTGWLQLGTVNPEYGLVSAPEGDDDCYSMGLYCEDADAVVAAAVEEGATVREELMNFASGDRFASIRDPFGVRWTIMSRVEDLSESESNRRVTEWAAQQ